MYQKKNNWKTTFQYCAPSWPLYCPLSQSLFITVENRVSSRALRTGNPSFIYQRHGTFSLFVFLLVHHSRKNSGPGLSNATELQCPHNEKIPEPLSQRRDAHYHARLTVQDCVLQSSFS